MSSIEIIQLSPSDWQTYKQIQLEALQNDPQAFGSSYDEWTHFSDEKWQERPTNPATTLFIAKKDTAPIGLVGIYINPKEEHKVAEIWGMYVNNSYRGMGIGKRLITSALEKTVSLPTVEKVKLMVNIDQIPAIELYKKLGFQIIETTDYLLGDGKNHKLYIMEKSNKTQ